MHEGPCPRCGRANRWEPLAFATADGRTFRCGSCGLTGPGWCETCLDTARRGWVSSLAAETWDLEAFADMPPNSARWCPAHCYRVRTVFRNRKATDEEKTPEAQHQADVADRAAEAFGGQPGPDRRKDLDPLPDGSWPAKWRKLKKEGVWGALVFSAKVRAGDFVTVQRRDASTEIRTVEEVVWTGDGIAICRLEEEAARW